MIKYYFFGIYLDEMVHIGQTIYNPYGRKCTVESIKSVKRLDNGKIEVEGVATFDKPNDA
jgi:hypothetical protein